MCLGEMRAAPVEQDGPAPRARPAALHRSQGKRARPAPRAREPSSASLPACVPSGRIGRAVAFGACNPARPRLPSSASKCACHFLTSRPRSCPSRSPPRGLGHCHVESGDCGPERGGPKPRPGAWGRALASRCLWTAGSDPMRPHVVTGRRRRVSPAPRDSWPHEASRDAAWRLRPSPDEERPEGRTTRRRSRRRAHPPSPPGLSPRRPARLLCL